jgi:para-nitrobenzyl esterase
LVDRYRDDDDLAHSHRVWTDLFRRPSVETASAVTGQGGSGWLYRFDVPTTILDGRLGATHACELAFTFNWIASDTGALVWHDRSAPGVADLARRWSDTVIQFARTGDPNGAGLPEWPTYSPTNRACMMLDIDCRVDVDPDGAHRELWT